MNAITTRPDVSVRPRSFVPDEFDPTDLDALRGLCRQLLERPLDTAARLEAWLVDRSELEAAVRAGGTRRRVAMTRDTADPAVRARHLDYERCVVPEFRRVEDLLSRYYLAAAGRAGLDGKFRMYDREVANEVDLFREANVDLLAREQALATEYAALTGNRTVPFRGTERTTQQVRVFLLDPDRATREEAYRALAAVRARDAARTDALFDRMLGLRASIAANAGEPDYRAYRFRELKRFDYTPDDCLRYHDAVESAVVPLLARWMERKRRLLNVASLRPWDGAADPWGRPTLRPFDDEAGFIDLGRRLFRAVDPGFESEFEILVRNGLLDLMSRPGKAPGGYNSPVADIRLPFVFANAVGTHKDLRTLLHEGGHAFHTLATRDEPVLRLATAPIEFCEVASMAMELFGLEHFDTIYAERDARTAAAALLEERLKLPVWVAAIDAFQHWVYTHPGHTPEERAETWVGLRRRFTPWVDYTGIEDLRTHEWHGQLHVFRYPFYYIEYGLALIGALQLWRRYRDDPAEAIAGYRSALALGGTRSLPELFAAGGARFGMDEAILGDVFGDLVRQLDRLG